MTAAAAATETDERRESETDSVAGLPPVGYVNAPVTTDYLRPVADRTTAETSADRGRQSDSSDSALAAAVNYIDDNAVEDSSCDINPPQSTGEFGTDA